MANILILYYSESGNTEKMALFVYRGAKSIPGTTVRLRSVEEATGKDLEWCDGIAVGAPTNFGGIPWKMKKWWDDNLKLWPHIDGKFGCTFSSCGAWGGGAELNCLSLLIVLVNFGFLVFGLTDYTGPKFSGHYGAVLAGEPFKEHEREVCVRLGLRLAEWCAYYIDGKRERHPLNQDYNRLPPKPVSIESLENYSLEILKAKENTI